jgi:hypothetical protein
MQSLKLRLNSSKPLPDKTPDDDLSADLQDDSLATNPKSILINLNSVHNYLKSLNIGEVDPSALREYQNILQKFYESLTNKSDEASGKVNDEITEIYNKINRQFLKIEKEILQQNSSSSGSTKLPQILEVKTPRSNDTPRQNTPSLTPRDELIISQQQKISESRETIKDLLLEINHLKETIKEIDAKKTQYQQELSFYKEQNQFLDESNTDIQNQLKSLERKIEDQSQKLKSLKDENDQLIQDKEQLAEQFGRERTNFRASLNHTLEGIRAVENDKIKLETQISDYKINADELKKQIQELAQTNQELAQTNQELAQTNQDLLTYTQELELEQTLRENPLDPLFSEIYSQSDRFSRDAGDKIYLEGDQLLSSSVLGELKTQEAGANESDFPLENNSQTSGDDFRQRPDDLENPIYLSSQPISSQPDSGQKILTPKKLQTNIEKTQSSQPQENLELTTGNLAQSPIAISSTPQNLYQNPTPSNQNATAIATLGFAGSSSDSDSPAQKTRPSTSPSPQQIQLSSTTASQGVKLDSSNSLPRNTQSSQNPSCLTRLLPRCVSPTP